MNIKKFLLEEKPTENIIINHLVSKTQLAPTNFTSMNSPSHFLRTKIAFLFFFGWISLLQNPVQAQNQAEIDSLHVLLAQAKSDTSKARILLDLANWSFRIDIKSGIDFAEKSLALSKKEKFPFGLMNATSSLQRFYLLTGKYDDSENYAKQALDYALEFNDSTRIASAYSNLGNVASRQGNQEKAFKFGLQGLEIHEQLGDENGQAKILSNLGNYLWYAGQGKEALPYFERSLALKKKIGDVRRQASTLNSLGNLYDELGEPEKALEALNQAIEINKEVGNSFGLSINYTTAGIIYDGQKDYLKAQEFHEKALQISREIDDLEGEAINSENLGNNLAKQKKYRQAIVYLKDALRIAKAQNYTNQQVSILKTLGETYQKVGDLQNAFPIISEYASLQDSLNKEKNQQTLAEMKTKYEAEQKNQQIELLTKSNEIQELNIQKQRVWSYSLLAILGLVAILAFVLWKQYQLKLRTSQLLASKNKELETLNATKDKLFAIIAHDLKNPLSAFRTITSSLSENLMEISKEEIEYFLKSLESSANQLYGLLQNLLSWSISQINQLPYQPENLKIPQVVEANFALLSANANEKNISLSHELSETDSVFANPSMLRTILRNFISNAIKFTPQNGEIKVFAHSNQENTRIEVADNGIGIAKSDLKKLFRIEEDITKIGNSPEKGTGLGLVLCQELAQKMNGSVGATSELGKGSIFYVEIPKGN